MDKYYLTDMGLGRIRNSGFKLEMGALLENVVYNELLVRGFDVYVGKTRKGGVDSQKCSGVFAGEYEASKSILAGNGLRH